MQNDIVDNKVYKYRQDKQATQEDLARAVGVSRQTVIAIEKGNYTPSVLLALKIAKFFDTKVENLFAISYERKK